MKRIRNQAVRRNDLRGLPVGGGVNWRRIFDWVQFILGFDRATDLLVAVDCNSFDPRHMIRDISKSLLSKVTGQSPTASQAGSLCLRIHASTGSIPRT